MGAITGVNHITLMVTDLDRSLAFYRDLLGGHVCAFSDKTAYLEFGPLWLCISLAPVSRRDDNTHIALTCAAAEFGPLAARIAAQAPIWKDNASEGDSLYFLDPDGHKLELAAGTLATRLAYLRAHPELGIRIV